MKLLKELAEHDENFHGLVAVNSLETYVVRLSMKLLKELVEHDENVHGLVPVNSLENYLA
jgi:predicted small metal-binding protein